MATDIHISTKMIQKKQNLIYLSQNLTKKDIRVRCPTCGTQKVIKLSTSLINQDKPITVISIPTGKICEHHFQIFMDKNFTIRSYQKVDYILPEKDINIKTQRILTKQNADTNHKTTYLGIHFEGNNIDYHLPKEKKNTFFRINYDKLIQLLLDKITTLNELFNNTKIEHDKEDIKFSIMILEGLLEEQGKAENKELSFRDFQSLEEFITLTVGL
ncbi:MAG: hypothetical protein ACTSR8_06200 [Promethearchaeota archaeon]